jgi:hypothetical protein
VYLRPASTHASTSVDFNKLSLSLSLSLVARESPPFPWWGIDCQRRRHWRSSSMIHLSRSIAFILALSTVQGFVISRSPSTRKWTGLGEARSFSRRCLTATYMQLDEESSDIPEHIPENNGKPPTSLVSSSLTQVLVSDQGREGRSKTRGRFRSLVRRVVDTVIIWPGETVGTWVLGARGVVPAKSPPFLDDEEPKGMQQVDAFEDDEHVELRPSMVSTPSVSASDFRKAPSSGQAQEREGRGPETYAQRTGRLDALMQRYSARRFGDADPALQQERISQANDLSEQMERRSPSAAAAASDKDRAMQLLDSYAKRHEGSRPSASSQVSSSSGGRKPVYRSKYADFGEDKTAPQTQANPRRGHELQMRMEAKSNSSRLDQLMNRYAEKGAKPSGSQYVRKGPKMEKAKQGDDGTTTPGVEENVAKHADTFVTTDGME